jgi:hypothetical protein
MTTINDDPRPSPPDFSKFDEQQLPIEIIYYKSLLKDWLNRDKIRKAAMQTKPEQPRNNGIFTIHFTSSPVPKARDYMLEVDQSNELPYVRPSYSRETITPIYAPLFEIGHPNEIKREKKTFQDYLNKFKFTYTCKYKNNFITTNQILIGSLLRMGRPGLGYKKGMKFNKDGLFISTSVIHSYREPIVTYIKSHSSRYQTLYQLYIELLKIMLAKESCGGYSIEVHVKQAIMFQCGWNIVSQLVRPPEKVSFLMVMKEIKVEML